MRKPFTTAATLMAAGAMMLGSAIAQQTPASNPKPAATATQAPSATAAKPHPPVAKTATPLVLKTDKDKTGYAIGAFFGAQMRRDSLDVDPKIVAKGLQDAFAGGKQLMTDDEVKAAMTALQTDMRKKAEEKMQLAGAENKKTGDAFLEANKTKDGVVTLPSGLQYKILTNGTGPKPALGDTVSCNYKGAFVDGKEFDSSYRSGKPANFPVTGVIKGWTEALQLMPVGSKWQLFIPSDLAYGPNGRGPIPPSSVLVFELELLSIQPGK